MDKDQLSRKLAVILHADIVGSTLLVQKNETLAHERIQDTFRRFAETISNYEGIAHEIRGDALVAEFARASDAVGASIAFQATNTTQNEQLSDDIRPELRIGIAMGEVVVADNTVTGDGVVLAQRIEQLTEPCGVSIQGAAYETIPKRLPFAYEKLGECELKGFEEPVRIFAVRLKPGTAVPEREAQIKQRAVDSVVSDEPSIAVLPFTNMSGDPEQEYFSDGITEDIITALSCISGLLVVARNSTMVYKDKAVDIKEVGREQGVRYVLEGSVRKSGNRIRVTAQLIDSSSGHHLWAEHYDRQLDDIFMVQDDITHQITVEMRVKLSLGEKARMLAGRTKNVQAWQRQLRADELNNSFIREDNREARRLAKEALQFDPGYVSAWTELGWTHCEDALCGWTDSTERSVNQALDAVQKALELEEDYPFALSLLGYVYLFKGEYDLAIEVAEKAVEFAPNNSESIAELAHVLIFAGKPEEAIEIVRKAIRLTPMDTMWHTVILGLCYHSIDEQELAITTFQEAVAMEPGSSFPRIYLVSALIESGLLEEATQTAREVIRIERNFTLANWQGALFRDLKTKEKMLANLLQAGLPG